MNTLRGFGQMTLGGALRPFHVGTNQTAIFCDLRKLDLADYNDMFASLLPTIEAVPEAELQAAVAGGQPAAEVATTRVVAAKRRALSPAENRDFIYSALAAGAQNAGLPVGFTAEEVGNWLDDEESDGQEAAKPLLMHLELMKQRMDRHLARLTGNAPAPASSPGPASSKKRKAEHK